MPISRYPRQGHPLAPTILKPVLGVRIPKKLLGSAVTNVVFFSDLTKSAWETFPPEVCRQLGTALVETIRAVNLTKTILRTPLPAVPPSLSIEDLELEQRTYNCLCKMRREGLLAGPEELSTKTIRDILNVEHFGAKSLVDLLTSLEAAGTDAAPNLNEEGKSKEAAILSEDTLAAAFVGRLRNLRLPTLPAGIELGDLHLAKETHACLVEEGFAARIGELANLTLAEALTIRGFGIERLLDYLDAVDHVKRDANGKPEQAVGPRLNDYERLMRYLFRPGRSTALRVKAEPQERHRYLEDEMRALIKGSFKSNKAANFGRNTDMIATYYGCDGRGGATLAEVANQYGLTRERVRQICMKSAQRMKKGGIQPERLRAVSRRITELLPCEADSLERVLQSEGFTRGAFRVKGVLLFSQMLGEPALFQLEDIDGRRMVVAPETARMTRRTIFQSRKAVSQFGVATVLDLAAVLSEQLSTTMTPEVVTRVLNSQPGFEWLDREAGWFWFRHLPRNRVVSRIRKILSVSEGIDVGELRIGIARHHAMDGYAPPKKVLLELCKRLPYCVVDGHVVRAEPPIDWKTTLRGAELSLITILKENGPAMQRPKLEKRCLDLGMKRSTFYAYLSYSPVIERYASGVYGIRGAAIEPGVVESLIPYTQRTRGVRLDHGWTRDRRIWIGYCVSEGMLGNGAFSVPAGLKQFLQGTYAMKSADGAAIGTVVVKDNAGWGLGTLFRRRGGEPGDTLLLIFDAKAQLVTAAVGDEGLLEQFDDEGEEEQATEAGKEGEGGAAPPS